MFFNIEEIEICGKKREWKDCSNKVLREYQKEIESLSESFTPKIDEIEELQEEITEVGQDLEDINEKIEVLKNKENTTDKENKEIITLIDNRKALRSKIRDLTKEVKKIDKESKELIDTFEEELPKKRAEQVSKLVDISPEEYLNTATDYDEFLSRHLSEIRTQLLAGISTKTIIKNLTKVLKSQYDESFQ